MKLAPKPGARFVLLKTWAAEVGLPYGSMRDAFFRGEFAVLKLGSEQSRRPRWYVERAEMDAWLARRVERAS